MAITTFAGLKAGLQPPIRFSKAIQSNSGDSSGPATTQWAMAGNPGAGSYDTTLNGVALTGPVTGGIVYPNPSSGNAYLARFQNASSSGGSQSTIWLCDRLWHNGGIGITTTTAQAITSPTWPPRDLAGSTNGEGVFIAMEQSVLVGAVPALGQTTISYTNSAGTSGRTGNLFFPGGLTGRSKNQGLWFFDLQAGDVGVRSVQSITLGVSYVSGTINLVAYRPILFHTMGKGGLAASDAVQLGNVRIFDNSVLYICAQRNFDANSDGGLQLVSGTIGLSHG